MEFSTISQIRVEAPETWKGKLFLTFDVDWAHDDVVGDVIDLVESADVSATWFITHRSKVLDRLQANPNFEIGDLMILNDHINLILNPLIGHNDKEVGPRFPDMSESYCPDMIAKAEQIASDNNIKVQKGIYVAVTGPTLETPAEYSYFRKMGGDTVGMSTVPEIIVARHMDIPCFAISVITDLGVPGKIKKVTHEDVQAVAEVIEPKLTLIIKQLISNIKL